jgi:hypothetical protein
MHAELDVEVCFFKGVDVLLLGVRIWVYAKMGEVLSLGRGEIRLLLCPSAHLSRASRACNGCFWDIGGAGGW